MSQDKKRYWVYTIAWRYDGQSNWHYTEGLHCGSVTDLYIQCQKRPYNPHVISLTEIDADEYCLAEKTLIGRLD